MKAKQHKRALDWAKHLPLGCPEADEGWQEISKYFTSRITSFIQTTGDYLPEDMRWLKSALAASQRVSSGCEWTGHWDAIIDYVFLLLAACQNAGMLSDPRCKELLEIGAEALEHLEGADQAWCRLGDWAVGIGELEMAGDYGSRADSRVRRSFKLEEKIAAASEKLQGGE